MKHVFTSAWPKPQAFHDLLLLLALRVLSAVGVAVIGSSVYLFAADADVHRRPGDEPASEIIGEMTASAKQTTGLMALSNARLASPARGRERAEKLLDTLHTCPIKEITRLVPGPCGRGAHTEILAYFATEGASR